MISIKFIIEVIGKKNCCFRKKKKKVIKKDDPAKDLIKSNGLNQFQIGVTLLLLGLFKSNTKPHWSQLG